IGLSAHGGGLRSRGHRHADRPGRRAADLVQPGGASQGLRQPLFGREEDADLARLSGAAEGDLDLVGLRHGVGEMGLGLLHLNHPAGRVVLLLRLGGAGRKDGEGGECDDGAHGQGSHASMNRATSSGGATGVLAVSPKADASNRPERVKFLSTGPPIGKSAVTKLAWRASSWWAWPLNAARCSPEATVTRTAQGAGRPVSSYQVVPRSSTPRRCSTLKATEIRPEASRQRNHRSPTSLPSGP